MPIKGKISGSYDRSVSIIKDGINVEDYIDLDKYGIEGVESLKNATPSSSGRTSTSWYYTIEHKKNTVSINFNNSYIENGMHIAIIIDKGHATKNGNWVSGKHYIDDAIDPIYKKIVKEIQRRGLAK